MFTRLLACSCIGLMFGCSHPLDIVGEGDILSDSGDNHCFLETAPCDVIAVREYQETYRPQARPGYTFVSWEGCFIQQGNACIFNIERDVVRNSWGRTAPALVARFAPVCANAPADSFTVIQQQIFDSAGCAASGCHGAAQQAGLRLSSGAAYGNLVNVDATEANLKRVKPGNALDSFLFQKLAARTFPGSFTVQGNPMPTVGAALSESQLFALAIWINAGAPQTGRADDLKRVEQLLGVCN